MHCVRHQWSFQKEENKIVEQTNFVVSMELEDLNMKKKNLFSSLIYVNYMDTKWVFKV